MGSASATSMATAGKTSFMLAAGTNNRESNADTSRWMHHPAKLTAGYGGAEMYAYDVDGDGDNDIITSDSAHDFGLSWYEQIADGDAIDFKRHQIMGSHVSENKYGVLFSELHSLALADMDGDGLKDIVTGKTYWSHHAQSPMWDAGAVVYWFKLVRGDDGVDWIPYQADGEAGIGRQVSVTDLNADGLPDIVVGGMKGAHVLTHKTTSVTKEQWQAAQPKRLHRTGTSIGRKLRRQAGTEVEARREIESRRRCHRRRIAEQSHDRWRGESCKTCRVSAPTSGAANRNCGGPAAKPGDTLTLELPAFTGVVDLDVVLTCARDYGIVQLSLDDKPLGDPIDLYETDVVTTGVIVVPETIRCRKQTHAWRSDRGGESEGREVLHVCDRLPANQESRRSIRRWTNSCPSGRGDEHRPEGVAKVDRWPGAEPRIRNRDARRLDGHGQRV